MPKFASHLRNRRFFAMLLLPAIAVGLLVAASNAQRKKPAIKPKVFELGKSAPKKSTPKQPATKSQTESTGLTRGRGGFAMSPRRWATRIDKLAIELDRAAADAFSRGLMPMRDYARHLDIVENLFAASSDLRRNTRRKRYAVDAHAQRLAEAAGKIKSLNQPATKGAAAELLLARFLTAHTRDRSLAMRRGGKPRSNPETAAAAMKYFKKIKEDHSIGLADDRQLADAAVLTAQAASPAKQAEAWKAVAKSAEDRAKKLATIPGNRFAITIAHLQAVADEAVAFSSRNAGRKSDADRALLAAIKHRDAEFQVLQKRSTTKTASLYQLARSWSDRFRMQAGLTDEHSPTTRAMSSDLRTIEKLAETITDRRGRNAADLLYVQALRELWRLPATSTVSTTAGSNSRTPRIKPQVIDLKPKSR